MKMTPAHYAALKAKIEPLTFAIKVRLEGLRDDPSVKDLQRRVLWDAFHATRIMNDYTYQEFDYQDTHIETAMRALFKELHIEIELDPQASKVRPRSALHGAGWTVELIKYQLERGATLESYIDGIYMKLTLAKQPESARLKPDHLVQVSVARAAQELLSDERIASAPAF